MTFGDILCHRSALSYVIMLLSDVNREGWAKALYIRADDHSVMWFGNVYDIAIEHWLPL